MEHAPSDDISLLADAAERFARGVVAKAASRLDATNGEELERVLAAASELGLLSLCAPAAAGGLDQDIDLLCAVLRPIAREDAGFAALLLVQSGAHHILRSAGAWPEALPASDLVTWPAFGATAAELRLHVSADGRRLDGDVALVPLAGRARHLLLEMRDASGDPSLALCSMDAEGMARAAVPVLGLSCCAPSDLKLASVGFSALAITNHPGADSTRAWLSLAVSAIALGILEGSFATALDYARQRRQGGRLIVEWPEVQRMLADLHESVSVLGSALSGALERRRGGDPSWRDGATILALRATESARVGTSDGVQILGGNGYMKEYPQERRMRDARQLRCVLGPAAARSKQAFAAWLAGFHSHPEAIRTLRSGPIVA